MSSVQDDNNDIGGGGSGSGRGRDGPSPRAKRRESVSSSSVSASSASPSAPGPAAGAAAAVASFAGAASSTAEAPSPAPASASEAAASPEPGPGTGEARSGGEPGGGGDNADGGNDGDGGPDGKQAPSPPGSSASSSSAPASAPPHRRYQTRRSLRRRTSLLLNDLGVRLIECGSYSHAIDVLRDSMEVLTARRDGGVYSGYSLEVKKAESLVRRAEERRAEERRRAGRGQGQGGGSLGGVGVGGASAEGEGPEWAAEASSYEDSEDCPFIYARPVRIHPETSSTGPPPPKSFPSLQSLLIVLSYNLALAHHRLGSLRGSSALIDKATSLYKMSESILLQSVDDLARHLPCVDATYLARAIVNNMGQILWEWRGDPDGAREYFAGLGGIDLDRDSAVRQRGGGSERDRAAVSTRERRRRRREEEDRERGEGRIGRWNAFAVNALISRGARAAPSA